jgi:nitrite reductase/ring-hydroxylating ferredoxin subunit
MLLFIHSAGVQKLPGGFMSEHGVDEGATQENLSTTQAQHRRQVLKRFGWITAGLLFFGGQLWLFLKFFLSPDAPNRMSDSFVAGPAERFAIGSVTHFWKQRFLLVRHPNGFLALSQECTHNPCNVDFLPEQHVIHCPCHGAQFSLTGTVLTGPATRPLDRFVTTLRDGQVVVDTTRRLRVKNSY